MIAGLLYLIGLITIVVTVAIVGVHAPALLESFNASLNGPGGGPMAAVSGLAGYLSWTVTPLIGGLGLMGFGRVIMLLGAINRALRGTP